MYVIVEKNLMEYEMHPKMKVVGVSESREFAQRWIETHAKDIDPDLEWFWNTENNRYKATDWCGNRLCYEILDVEMLR